MVSFKQPPSMHSIRARTHACMSMRVRIHPACTMLLVVQQTDIQHRSIPICPNHAPTSQSPPALACMCPTAAPFPTPSPFLLKSATVLWESRPGVGVGGGPGEIPPPMSLRASVRLGMPRQSFGVSCTTRPPPRSTVAGDERVRPSDDDPSRETGQGADGEANKTCCCIPKFSPPGVS